MTGFPIFFMFWPIETMRIFIKYQPFIICRGPGSLVWFLLKARFSFFPGSRSCRSCDENLIVWRDKLKEFIPQEASEYFLENNSETELDFPVLKYPDKPKSLNLEKTPSYEGVLSGIKGQYLIFEDNTVFNVRSNEGYVVEIGLG